MKKMFIALALLTLGCNVSYSYTIKITKPLTKKEIRQHQMFTKKLADLENKLAKFNNVQIYDVMKQIRQPKKVGRPINFQRRLDRINAQFNSLSQRIDQLKKMRNSMPGKNLKRQMREDAKALINLDIIKGNTGRNIENLKKAIKQKEKNQPIKVADVVTIKKSEIMVEEMPEIEIIEGEISPSKVSVEEIDDKPLALPWYDTPEAPVIEDLD